MMDQERPDYLPEDAPMTAEEKAAAYREILEKIKAADDEDRLRADNARLREELEKAERHISNAQARIAELGAAVLHVQGERNAAEAKLARAEKRLEYAMEDARKYNPDGGYCPAREDHQHCDCWWEGNTCCACGAPGMTDDEKLECGMLDDSAALAAIEGGESA